LKHNFKTWILKKFRVIVLSCLRSPLSKNETRHDSSSLEQGRNASRLLTHFNDKSLYRN